MRHFAGDFLVVIVQRLKAGKAYHPAVPAAARVGTAVEVAGNPLEAVLDDAGGEILAVAARMHLLDPWESAVLEHHLEAWPTSGSLERLAAAEVVRAQARRWVHQWKAAFSTLQNDPYEPKAPHCAERTAQVPR